MTVKRTAGRRGNGTPPFKDAKIRKLFADYPQALREQLTGLRELIFDTASSLDIVGPLDEMLKWGQPSYLTAQSKSGSTIRIDALKDRSGYAMYFHCQTNLVETFRELYPAQLAYDGNRAILFKPTDKIPEKALRHCIGLALTYHARQKPARAKVTSKIAAPKPRARLS